jgi:hypothetical protein
MKMLILAFSALTAVAFAGEPIDWQAVAVKNFPELGKKDSEMHARFLRGVERMKKDHPEFFKAANWPLQLARMAAPPTRPFAGLGLSDKEILAIYGPCTEQRAFAPATRALRSDKVDYWADFEFVDGRCVRIAFERMVEGDFTAEDGLRMRQAAAEVGWQRATDFLYLRDLGLGIPNNPGERRWRYEPKFCNLRALCVGSTMTVTSDHYDADFRAESRRQR